MADKNSSKNNFIMQAGILAAAGIISRIIGLLYRGPLQSVIGNLGLGYYQSAYNYYTIILLISSYSIPSAISKAIAQKLGEKEYRNAHRLFHGAMVYVLVVGGIASLFLFFGAGLFVSGAAVTVLRTFAPTIFVYGILGVLRGYFQAHKSMAQTSVSQILEQIANAVVSVGAAYLLIQMFMGTMEVPADQAGQVVRATYGAVGSALGTGVGVLVALLFMAGVYALNRGMILRRVRYDRHTHVDSYGQIFKTITMVVTPFILSTAVYNLSSTVNNSIYTKWYPSLRNLDTVSIYEKYGRGQFYDLYEYCPLEECLDPDNRPNNGYVIVAGYVSEMEVKKTRKGESFCRLVLESNYEFIEIVVFQTEYAQLENLLQSAKYNLIIINGTLSWDKRREQNIIRVSFETNIVTLTL